MTIENTKKTIWWKPAMEMLAIVSGWIVVPILIGLFLGKWLDEKYNGAPWYTIICVGVAFVITNIGLILHVIKAAKQIEAEAKIDVEEKRLSNDIENKL